MKIEQLTVENFKCFKREQTFDFSRLTILTGANSSGKSSVLAGVLMVIQSEDFPHSISTNGDYIELGDFKDISHKHKEDFIKINVVLNALNDIKYIINSTFELNHFDGLPKLLGTIPNTSVVGDISTFNANQRFNINTIINEHFKILRTWSSNYISAFRQSPKRTYLEKNKTEYRTGTEGEDYIHQIVEWDKRSNGKIKQLVETMKQLQLIEDIKINRLGGGRFEVLIKPVNSDGFSALNDVGSGVSAFMPIIVADLQMLDDSTLFLAEPEIHLHPSVQAKFGDYIVNQINNSEKNYVIETHSEYFLNRIRLAIVKGELKKEDVKVYFLENTKEDTNVYDIDFKKNGAIKNAPDTFFETYSMDVMDIALNSFAE